MRSHRRKKRHDRCINQLQNRRGKIEMTKSNKNTKTKKNAQQQHNRKINRFPNQRKPDNTKNRRAQPRNEFRKYKKSGHPAYIYEKIGDEFIFLGITHNSVGEGTTKIRLEASPNPEDKKTTYMKKTPEIDKTNRFGSVKKGWKLSEKDKEKVKKIRSAPR